MDGRRGGGMRVALFSYCSPRIPVPVGLCVGTRKGCCQWSQGNRREQKMLRKKAVLFVIHRVEEQYKTN